MLSKFPGRSRFAAAGVLNSKGGTARALYAASSQAVRPAAAHILQGRARLCRSRSESGRSTQVTGGQGAFCPEDCKDAFHLPLLLQVGYTQAD